MKLEDIIALTKAGYTKADIMALTTEPAQEPNETSIIPTIQEPVAEEVAQPVEDQAAEVPAVNTDLTALLEEVKALRAAVNKRNVLADSLPTPSREDIATKILGEVINPHTK